MSEYKFAIYPYRYRAVAAVPLARLCYPLATATAVTPTSALKNKGSGDNGVPRSAQNTLACAPVCRRGWLKREDRRLEALPIYNVHSTGETVSPNTTMKVSNIFVLALLSQSLSQMTALGDKSSVFISNNMCILFTL
mmetsp:Transcript_20418/g.38560  ORF Transcript_20418/g.38560 Transcript_20418/m.38560 type:complete len:137 (-) Transcript_20418:22-432(-)